MSPQWEINLGVGVGLTRSTDHLIVKLILGYRFNFQRRAPKLLTDLAGASRPTGSGLRQPQIS